MQRKCYAIILASGEGVRFGSNIPKQFIKIKGKTIIEHSIERFHICKCIDEITLVINPKYNKRLEELELDKKYDKFVNVVEGGMTRMQSSFLGLRSINANDTDIVLIHDAVRPLVTTEIINSCYEKLKLVNAVAVAIPVTDTIYKASSNNIIEDVVGRKYLIKAQTPQGFRYGLIKKAYEIAMSEKEPLFTDDVSLILNNKLDKVYWIQGDEKNIKITYPIDEKFAGIIIDQNEI